MQDVVENDQEKESLKKSCPEHIMIFKDNNSGESGVNHPSYVEMQLMLMNELDGN